MGLCSAWEAMAPVTRRGGKENPVRRFELPFHAVVTLASIAGYGIRPSHAVSIAIRLTVALPQSILHVSIGK